MDVIKEYLISLGFRVNSNEFDRATRAVSDLGRTVNQQSSAMSKSFSAAAAAMTTALVSITSATVGMLTQVAKADMEYQKLALHMYTTKETAKELKTVLDTMGESMEDVAWIPELRQQYMALMGQARQMNTPGDAEGQLKSVRGVIFEFRRLKLEATYALQWVSYYLLKYLSGPFGDFREKLKNFNDWIVKSMPEWTNKIAKWLAMIFNLLKSVGKVISSLFITIKDAFTSLPASIKMVVAAIALMMSPFAGMFVAIGGLLILIEDFFGYMEGRRSSKTLAPMWKRFLEFKNDFDRWSKDTLPMIKMKIDELITSLEKLGKETLTFVMNSAKALFSELDKSMTETGTITRFKMAISSIDKGFMSISNGLTSFMKKMGLIASDEKSKGFWSWISGQLTEIINKTNAYVKAIGGMADVVGLVLEGKFREAAIKALSTTLSLGVELKSAGEHKNLGTSQNWGTGNTNVDQTIAEASQRYGVPEEMIRRVIQQESGFQEGVVSEAGAIGYMQLMPGTAEALGVNPYNGSENIMGGTQYLAQQYAKFGSWEKALAAYNAGPGAVEKYGGIPPYAETQNYVRSIMSGYGGSNIAGDMMGNYGFSNSYANSGTTTNNGLSIGAVNVNITEPGANQQQIYNATLQAIQDSYNKSNARETREFSGVFG
jgi:hypothetical protein